GETKQNRTTHEFRPSVFTITPAGTQHDQIDMGAVTSYCLGLINSGLEPCEGSYKDMGGELCRTIERLFDELKKKGEAHELILKGILLEIVGLTRRCIAESDKKPRKEALVEKAIEIINSENGMLTVGELSSQLFVSHDYLRHLFSEYSDQSPMRHIVRARVEKAADLLCKSELPISEIAERCGFESPYYFSRLFKQVTKLTPSKYRSQHSA
ncbi:MAG: helix-turn-helix transcriptional regulator, partial [Planctomycetes bacterium]|nr:helix-turn-helix transcriptional regulator [Planctomycetota bacterium]